MQFLNEGGEPARDALHEDVVLDLGSRNRIAEERPRDDELVFGAEELLELRKRLLQSAVLRVEVVADTDAERERSIGYGGSVLPGVPHDAYGLNAQGVVRHSECDG